MIVVLAFEQSLYPSCILANFLFAAAVQYSTPVNMHWPIPASILLALSASIAALPMPSQPGADCDDAQLDTKIDLCLRSIFGYSDDPTKPASIDNAPILEDRETIEHSFGLIEPGLENRAAEPNPHSDTCDGLGPEAANSGWCVIL